MIYTVEQLKKISDPEIDVLVALKRGFDIKLQYQGDVPELYCIDPAKHSLGAKWDGFSPSSHWAHAMPIAEDYGICIDFAGLAFAYEGEEEVCAFDINPLRAICECFLLMSYEEYGIREDARKTRQYKDSEILIDWLEKENIQQFCASQVERKGPEQLRRKDRSVPAINILVKEEILETVPRGTVIDGEPSFFCWKVNEFYVQENFKQKGNKK